MGSKRTWLGTYANPHQKRVRRGWIHFLMWQFGLYKDPIPLPKVPQDFSFPNPKLPASPDLPQVTWVNHSTYFVTYKDLVFLFDPIWNHRCSPMSFIGPKRRMPPEFLIEELPKADFVVISHNHYDHLDLKTLHFLHASFPEITWICPKGLKKWFHRHFPEIEKGWILELDWGESAAVQGDSDEQEIEFRAVAAQHFSGRGLFDRNRTLWMGCIISIREGGELQKRIYFAGDTGYNERDFKEVGKLFAPIDLSLLPIGVYTPREFMRYVHVNPTDALMIHQEVGSRLSIAGHFGTFKLAGEPMSQPPFDLFRALQKEGIPWETFRVLQAGQTINW